MVTSVHVIPSVYLAPVCKLEECLYEAFMQLFSSDESLVADNDCSFANTHRAASDSQKTSAKMYAVGAAIDFHPSDMAMLYVI